MTDVLDSPEGKSFMEKLFVDLVKSYFFRPYKLPSDPSTYASCRRTQSAPPAPSLSEERPVDK